MKTFSRLFILFTASVLVISCEDDPVEKRLVTVNIQPGYFSNNDAWIFASDKIGRTLDIRKVDDSTTVHLSGGAGGSIMITIATHIAVASSADESIWHSFGFTSFQGIEQGSVLNIQLVSNNNNPLADEIGTASFTLLDYNDSDNPEHTISFTDGVSIPFSLLDYNNIVFQGSIFSSRFKLKQNPTDILATTYRNNIPVHRWLENVNSGDEISVSYYDFEPSSTIAVNKKVAYAEVKAERLDRGYILSSLDNWRGSSSSDLEAAPQLGYLPGFDQYFVHVALNFFHEPSNLYYTRRGAIPQSIDLPDFTYAIKNDALYDLSIDFSNDHTYKQAFFIVSTPVFQVNWTLNAPAGESFRAPAIPKEISNQYKMFSVKDLRLEFASYTDNLDGYSYDEYINNYFSYTQRETQEELRYVISRP